MKSQFDSCKTDWSSAPRMLAMAAAFFASALSAGAWADVIHVPADHPTIQAAIDAAVDGDEVVVADGTYAEAINFIGKAITVRSSDGPSTTTIDATGIGSPTVQFVTAEGSDSALDGFTITGGSGAAIKGSTYGGGLLVNGSSPTIEDCLVTTNQAYYGAGVACLQNSAATFLSCTFHQNVATSLGGGFFAQESSPSLTSCTFQANTAAATGGMRNETNSSPTLTDCTFTGNAATGSGGGLYNQWGCDPIIVGCTFVGNTAGNIADDWGGGMYNLDGSSPLVVGCRFIANETGGYGGGINNHNLSLPLIVNCLFVGNIALRGGGILNHSEAGPTLVNCTLVGNIGTQNGGGLFHLNNHHSEAGTAKMRNCIAWGNVPNQIISQSSPAVQVTYSLVQGGFTGKGNVAGDPLFADADGPDDDPATLEDNDYRLSSGSPAIDAGSNDAVPAEVKTDLDGNLRFVDDPDTVDSGQGTAPIVDMGAYEFQTGAACVGDLTSDSNVGPADLAELLANWGSCADPANCPSDFTGDDAVGPADLATLLSNWGVCP